MANTNGHKKFEVPSRTARLIFDDEYAGAEVRCRLDVPLGMHLEFAKLVDSQSAADTEEAFKRFSRDVLIDWNLTAEGEDIPAKPDGMLLIPPDLAKAILAAWVAQGQNAPLAERV